MSYTLIPLNDVSKAVRAGIAWKVRLEYVGYNADNLSGNSSKYWEMYSSDPIQDPRINHGKIGSRGLSNPKQKCVWDAIEVGRSKIKKGYSESPQTSRHWQVPAPVPVCFAPAAPVKVRLDGPMNNIHHVESPGPGHFEAVDEDGTLIMALPASSVRKLFALSPWVRHNSTTISDAEVV
jgi:predicted DNA-binding WGR domain protein